MKLESWDPEQDGPLSEKALREKLERKGYRASRYVYPPGTRFPEHAHEVDKIDAVLSGRFRVTIGERALVLEAGDSLVVPRGVRHSAEVIGEAPVISLDATKE